jgi:hypothetical protein|nr:hypothetical protein [Kofleriaceae bacterium]
MPTPSDLQLRVELESAEADLERKLATLREVVTERVDETVARVQRPLQWLGRHKWHLAGGAIAAIAALAAVRHFTR